MAIPIPHGDRRPTRVLLVDDHVVLRDGLQALIAAQRDFVVIGATSTAAEALRLAAELVPDIVVLDLRLPDGNGIQVARELSVCAPAPRVLVLTAYAAPQYIRAAKRIGVAGFLLKERAASQVLAALRLVAQGRTIFDIDASGAATQPASCAVKKNTLSEPLSRREREVLQLLANGARNDTIAEELGISLRTVEVHVSTILGKLQVCSRVEAIKIAVQQGLVTL